MAPASVNTFQFGVGTLFGTPNAGNTAANPTPTKFGTLQDVSIEFAFDQKELFGQNQFPDDVARGKGKITGKAKFARLNGKMLNDLFFGQTLSTGGTLAVLGEAHTIPATPFQVTIAPPNSGTFDSILEVYYNSTGIPLVQVASGPTQGQYSITGAQITFAAADTGVAVNVSYEYTVSSIGNTIAITNQLMGFAPRFRIDLTNNYNANQDNLRLFACVATKLSRPSKNDDYIIEEFDFAAYADGSGKVVNFYPAL